jgi:hypothetical protein
MRGGDFIALAVVAALLSGCAVKTLKAPCSRDEGPKLVPMAYSSLGAAEDEVCGPMRPVNEPSVGKGRAGHSQGHVAPARGAAPS